MCYHLVLENKMLGTVKYSDAEMALFVHFGMADIAPNIQPPILYTVYRLHENVASIKGIVPR
jgi:hypothetical protein